MGYQLPNRGLRTRLYMCGQNKSENRVKAYLLMSTLESASRQRFLLQVFAAGDRESHLHLRQLNRRPPIVYHKLTTCSYIDPASERPPSAPRLPSRIWVLFGPCRALGNLA